MNFEAGSRFHVVGPVPPSAYAVSSIVILLAKQSLRPRQTQRKCPEINATLTDNRKQQCDRQTGNGNISGTITDNIKLSTANLVLSTMESPISSRAMSPGDYNHRKWQYNRFLAPHVAISGCRSLLQSYVYTVFELAVVGSIFLGSQVERKMVVLS